MRMRMRKRIGSCGIIALKRIGLQYVSLQAARGEHREGSELKRFVLPNEVNTPSGRMRPSCRAETVVTSVILYKTGRSRKKTRGSIVGSGMRSKVGRRMRRKKKGKRRRRRARRRRRRRRNGEKMAKKPQTTKSSYASFLLQNRLFISIHLYFTCLSQTLPFPLFLFSFSLSLSTISSLSQVAIKMIK